MTLLPLKKRAIRALSNGSCGSSSSDDSCSSSPKKRRINGCVGAGSNDAGGCEAPVPCHRRPVSAAGAPAASPEPATKGNILSAAEKSLNQGKWVATAETTSSAAPQPPVKKYIFDGIRSGAPFKEHLFGHHAPPDAHATAAAAAAATTTAEENQTDDTELSEALRRRLAQLGATRPSFVYRKHLHKSDVCGNQNRLLVSCKGKSQAACPLTACFSPAEMRRVEDKEVGLLVTALDRDGEPQTLTCKFLDSNGGYRFISGWKVFLERNSLLLDTAGKWTRDVDVELRVFRSRVLPPQPLLDARGKLMKEEDGKTLVQGTDHLHPDGSLGLLLLHREHRRRRVECEDDDQEKGPPVPSRQKGTKQRAQQGASASVPVVPGEAALAGAGAEQGEALASAMMSKVEMVAKFGEPISSAAIGMMMLRGATEKQENVERGCGA